MNLKKISVLYLSFFVILVSHNGLSAFQDTGKNSYFRISSDMLAEQVSDTVIVTEADIQREIEKRGSNYAGIAGAICAGSIYASAGRRIILDSYKCNMLSHKIKAAGYVILPVFLSEVFGWNLRRTAKNAIYNRNRNSIIIDKTKREPRFFLKIGVRNTDMSGEIPESRCMFETGISRLYEKGMLIFSAEMSYTQTKYTMQNITVFGKASGVYSRSYIKRSAEYMTLSVIPGIKLMDRPGFEIGLFFGYSIYLPLSFRSNILMFDPKRDYYDQSEYPEIDFVHFMIYDHISAYENTVFKAYIRTGHIFLEAGCRKSINEINIIPEIEYYIRYSDFFFSAGLCF